MKIFQNVQTNLAILGITPNQTTRSFPYNSRIQMCFLMAGLYTISCFVYILCVAATFQEYVECIITTSAGIGISICFGGIVYHMSQTFETIHIVEKIIEIRSKYPKSKAIYEKSSQQIEKWCKILFIFVVKIASPCMMWPICIGSFIVYVTTDLGSDSFVLPLPMWFPFDTKEPIGYFVGISLECMFLGCASHAIACTICLGIASYIINSSTIKDIKSILHSINKLANNKRKRLEMLEHVPEYIDLHSTLKQLFQSFSEMAQPVSMVMFIWSLAAICSGMLMIQMKTLHHEISYLTLLLIMSESIYGVATAFIACDLGQRASNEFNEINSTIGQFDWYLFPYELKRMLPTIIAIAQTPVEVECFGSFSLSRDVSKRIANKAFSYFMVLRQLIR